MGPGVLGFPMGTFPLPREEFMMCSENLLSRASSNSDDMPGACRAWRRTIFSCPAVMPCSRFDIQGVRMTTSSQVIRDPGSRPRFIALKKYSAKVLMGCTQPRTPCHRQWMPHPPRTAGPLLATSRLLYSDCACLLGGGLAETA